MRRKKLSDLLSFEEEAYRREMIINQEIKSFFVDRSIFYLISKISIFEYFIYK